MLCMYAAYCYRRSSMVCVYVPDGYIQEMLFGGWLWWAQGSWRNRVLVGCWDSRWPWEGAILGVVRPIKTTGSVCHSVCSKMDYSVVNNDTQQNVSFSPDFDNGTAREVAFHQNSFFDHLLSVACEFQSQICFFVSIGSVMSFHSILLSLLLCHTFIIV